MDPTLPSIDNVPGTYLPNRRLSLAGELLADTDLSIAEIALQAGYGSVRSLRRHILAEFGCSPTAYRRRRQSE